MSAERYPWITPPEPAMDFLSLDEFHDWFVEQVQWRGPYNLDAMYADYLSGDWLYWPAPLAPDGRPWN